MRRVGKRLRLTSVTSRRSSTARRRRCRSPCVAGGDGRRRDERRAASYSHTFSPVATIEPVQPAVGAADVNPLADDDRRRSTCPLRREVPLLLRRSPRRGRAPADRGRRGSTRSSATAADDLIRCLRPSALERPRRSRASSNRCRARRRLACRRRPDRRSTAGALPVGPPMSSLCDRLAGVEIDDVQLPNRSRRGTRGSRRSSGCNCSVSVDRVLPSQLAVGGVQAVERAVLRAERGLCLCRSSRRR